MNEQNDSNGRETDRTRMGRINRALGLFICFFGAVVLVSIILTESLVGKMTNLGAGLIFVVVGIILILKSKTES
jgi:hypothetical protein